MQIQQKFSGVDRTLDGRRGAGEYDRIRSSILDEAAIVHILLLIIYTFADCSCYSILIVNQNLQVFSTLSFSGSSIFGRMTRPFDVVIIDEAAQAVRKLLNNAFIMEHQCYLFG